MSKFIEFKDVSYQTGILLNTNLIDYIINTGKGVKVMLTKPVQGINGMSFQTFEYPYEELKEMLTGKCRSEKIPR